MIRRPVRLYPRFPFSGASPMQTTLKALLQTKTDAAAKVATTSDDLATLTRQLTDQLGAAGKAQDDAKAADAKADASIAAALAKVAPNGSSVGPFTDADGSQFTLETGGPGGFHKAPLISPDTPIDLPDDVPTGGTGSGDATPPPLPTDGGLLPGMPGANPVDTQATDEAAPTGLNPDGTPVALP